MYFIDLWISRFGVFLNDWCSGWGKIGEINLILWFGIFSVSYFGSIILLDKLGRYDFFFRMFRVVLVFRDWLFECFLLFFVLLILNWKRFDLCCIEGFWLLFFLLIIVGVEWFFLIWEEEVVFDVLDFVFVILYVLLCFVVDVNIFFIEFVWFVFCFLICFCVFVVIIFDFICVYFLFVLNGVCVFFLKDKISLWVIV